MAQEKLKNRLVLQAFIKNTGFNNMQILTEKKETDEWDFTKYVLTAYTSINWNGGKAHFDLFVTLTDFDDNESFGYEMMVLFGKAIDVSKMPSLMRDFEYASMAKEVYMAKDNRIVAKFTGGAGECGTSANFNNKFIADKMTAKLNYAFEKGHADEALMAMVRNTRAVQ